MDVDDHAGIIKFYSGEHLLERFRLATSDDVFSDLYGILERFGYTLPFVPLLFSAPTSVWVPNGYERCCCSCCYQIFKTLKRFSADRN